MTTCQRCTSVMEADQACYTAQGERVCPSCYDESRNEDQAKRARDEGGTRSQIATVCAFIAFACAFARLALTLAG